MFVNFRRVKCLRRLVAFGVHLFWSALVSYVGSRRKDGKACRARQPSTCDYYECYFCGARNLVCLCVFCGRTIYKVTFAALGADFNYLYIFGARHCGLFLYFIPYRTKPRILALELIDLLGIWSGAFDWH